MASDTLKEERSKLTNLAINKYQLAADEGIGTDLIRCPQYSQANVASLTLVRSFVLQM
jgi:hypothetical protein